jgi:sugar-specific transcriptional regulator TrmB
MEIRPLLKDFGLLESEIRVYVYLLENGLSTPPLISKGSGIARTNVYAVLQQLRQKGLIEEHTKGKRKAYLATDPIALEQSFERRRETIHRMLPDLRSLYSTQKNKPKIQFFEGWEQVKQVFVLTLEAKEIFGIASTKQLFALEPSFFDWHRQQMKERGIVFHDILTHASGETSGPTAKEQLKGLYDFKLLSSDYDDFPTDILIWDDQVALIGVATPVFGTVLTNPALAKTFRMMFDMMWKGMR